jgi:hypothetical protein
MSNNDRSSVVAMANICRVLSPLMTIRCATEPRRTNRGAFAVFNSRQTRASALSRLAARSYPSLGHDR